MSFSSTTQAQDSTKAKKKDYPSKLWKITGNGLSKPSYLYGTMHVSAKVAFHLSDSVFIGINQCDIVALETNPQEWLPDMMNSRLMQDQRNMYSRIGTNTYGYYQNAFDLPILDNEGLAAQLRYEHSMVNPMLFRGSDFNQDFEEQTYLDMFIYQAGAKQGKKMMNLESFEESQRLGIEARIPDPKEKKKKFNYYSYSSDGKSIGEQIEDAYRKGDLTTLDSLQKYSSPSKKYFQLFLVERNRNMVEKMDSLMKTASVFSAIGAAHLAGEEGAIEMLREKGYTVRPVQSEITSKGRKVWRKLKKKTVPLSYNVPFVAEDSVFRLMAPGKMYQTQGSGHSKDYMFPDMTNGAYFSVSRMNNYIALQGISTEDLMTKMDSLFFENIPGDIHSKERIIKDGYPGFDILNETRTGDYQRYQIIFTPLEIFIFKMGGVGKFVKTESNKYFSTIKFTKPANSWVTRTFNGGAFRVSLPNIGDHKGSASSSMTFANQHEVIQAFDSEKSAYYLLLQSLLIDGDFIEDDTFELRQLIVEFGRQLKYETKELTFGNHEGYPMAQGKLVHKEHGEMIARCILRRNSFYLLVEKANELDFNNKFFTSFKFVEPSYTQPIFEQTDTFGHYTVKSTRLPDPIYKKAQQQRSYSYYTREANDDGDKDFSYLPERDYSSFVYRETGDVLGMYYYQYHRYAQTDSIEGFWKSIEKAYTDYDDRGFYVKKKTIDYDQKTDMHTMEMLLADTFSIREVRVKKILRSGALWSIETYGDSL
ncbi:MAG: TraB/GumN family protein, partial [Bacteroidetes bacterium]|nr:TraB/GumN family protein [Bacteroidota bacterium]